MNAFKKIFSYLPSRVWFIVTCVVLALFLAINIVCTTVLATVFDSFFGGPVAVAAKDGGKLVYESDYESKDDAYTAANKFNETICEEGFVLLKNEGNALPVPTTVSTVNKASANPKISVFGKNSYNIILGGSGSGGASSEGSKSLYSSLEDAGYELNPTLKSFYQSESASGKFRPAKPEGSNLDDGKTVTIPTYETPQSNYTAEVKSSYANYNAAAIVVISRMGGEGFDLPRTKGNGNNHYLQLDKDEKDLLAEVCAKFNKVIVLLNMGTSFECGFLKDYQNIKACLWIGFPGYSGAAAIGRILNGNVNPSGRTTDTFAADFTADPTYKNFGDNGTADGNAYIDAAGKSIGYYFVDYEEGIYSGYRYYETRGYVEKQKNAQSKWYEENVVFPMGYGLSYSAFTREITDSSAILDKDVSKDAIGKTYTVKVKVKNNSAVPGKDVVQLYGNAPLGDVTEKPYVTLLDFAKTPLIPANGEATVELTFDPYYLASYDTYGDGQYALESGNYNLFVSQNAHDFSTAIPFTVSQSVYYTEDPVTGNPVGNKYTGNENAAEDSALGMEDMMKREDFEGTFPTTPTREDRVVGDAVRDMLADKSPNRPADLPVNKGGAAGESIRLRDLIKNADGTYTDVDWDDERWEKLLNNCSTSDLLKMIDYGAFKSGNINGIGKPLTNDTDGPAGFTNFMLQDGTYHKTCFYACQMVVASTWSKEIAEGFGKSVGNEGIWGANGKGNALPYSGWYAPGMNIHRSPFGGRNFEYMSEDPVLTGKMAAAQIKGCQSKGVYCFMKHFAANEQETKRSINGLVTRVDEQTLREVYLRAFEIAVKEGKASGVMSSFNRIGARWAGGDYRLITGILRDEWGFKGSVITDFTSSAYMNAKQMYYAGGNLNLNNQQAFTWSSFSSSNDADVTVLRSAAKGVLYTVVHSNAMNRDIVGYLLALWVVWLIVIDCVLVALFATWGTLVILAAFGKLKLGKKKNVEAEK